MSGGTGWDPLPDGGGGGGGSAAPIGRTSYNPGAQTVISTTLTSFADLAAVSLAVGFTTPVGCSSVDVALEAVADIQPDENRQYLWNLRDASGNIAGTRRVITRGARLSRYRTRIRVTGLTESTAYSYKWGHAVSSSGGTGRIICGDDGSAIWGPALMEVYAA